MIYKKGEVGVRTMKQVQILLKADEGLKNANIMSALNTSRLTVERTRKRFVEDVVRRSPVF